MSESTRMRIHLVGTPDRDYTLVPLSDVASRDKPPAPPPEPPIAFTLELTSTSTVLSTGASNSMSTANLTTPTTRRRQNAPPRWSTAFAWLLLALAVAVRGEAADRYVVPLSKPGQPVRLEVGLVSGSITVEQGTSANEVIVEAVGEGGDDDHDSDRDPRRGGMRRLPNRSLGLVVEEEGNKVVVAMGGIPREVTLRLLVPRNTSADLSTVNDGDIKVTGLDGALELSNTNGEITARDVAGSVIAHTTNGDVKVTMSRVDPKTALAFATFNGDVDVTLPSGTHGELRMRSDNGEIYTDFDVTLATAPPRVDQQRKGGRYRLEIEQEVRGTIGGGGPEIQLRTFNGDIYLRKKG